MVIGKVVASDSHLQYRCRVYARGEVERPPTPQDYALGTFVSLPTGLESAVVGVVCDTVLQNPEFGVYGPRLSTAEETEIFTPDYMDEVCTVVMIVGLGHNDGERSSHDTSPIAPEANCEVSVLSPEAVRSFHLSPNGIRLGYLPLLLSLARTSPVYSQALLQVLADLTALFPDGEAYTRLCLLSQGLAWRLRIAGMG